MTNADTQSPVRWGVALLQMGGPNGLDEVEPFIRALLSDASVMGIPIGPLRGFVAGRIARKRGPQARERYREIGGRSPIGEQTEAQARALEERLSEHELPVEVAMRYSHPRAAAALDRLQDKGVTHVVGLPLYPQACRATSGSSLMELENLTHARGMHMRAVGAYPEMEGFIAPMAKQIRDVLNGMHKPCVIFSAHGLPERAASRDVYPEQVRMSAKALAARLPDGVAWRLAFQSRLGPVRWLRPYLDETVRAAAEEGFSDVIVVPISFVSEHIETLHELDIELKELALESGIARFERVQTVQSHPAFIEGLADLVLTTIDERATGNET